MRKLRFTRKLGFIIGIIVLLMAVMPLSVPVNDSLPAQAAEPPPPVPQEAPRLPPPQEPPPVIDGYGTGFIPPTMDLSHISGQRMPDGSLVGESLVGQPPVAFDWRVPSNRVTSVKNQGGCGSCYAFAALGNVESKILIDTNTTPPGPDYSENNSKECNWRELNNFQNPPGTFWGSCSGGNYRMLASLYSQKGVVLETCDPYVPVDVACNPSCPYNKTLLDWRVISGGVVPNTTVLKNYIMTYGPVYTTVYVDAPQGFNASYDGSYTFNYTISPMAGTNHAVLIVGWSNSLPPDQVTGLTGDGWIVKNSWGAGWGAGGYFYIRYGAANIGMWSSFMHSWQDYDKSGGIMYYDDDCGDNAWGWGPPTNSTTAWGLCNFTPTNNTYATRVEFWTPDTTTDIDIYIYDDFNVTTQSLSNLLVSQLNYNFTEAGYHGVNLSSPLPLTAGDDVIVVINFTNSVTFYPVMTDPNGPWVTNRTYLSLTGANGSWTDMGSFANEDVAIRLRTSVPSLNCACGDICVNTTGWWRDGGTFNASATPIQSAVNNATGGDTICVKDGTYRENVDVNTANLTIQSENGAANCVVNATDSNDHVFAVTADWVNITGFTVENATAGSNAGICLGSGVSHCNLSSNNATNNRYGIYLYYSSNNMLTNNIANSNSFYSIYLLWSSNNTLINNTASHNTGTYGIYLASSSNNTLRNNDGEDNLIGIRLSDSSNNTLDNNSANSNNYGIYLASSNSNNNLTNNTANSNNFTGIHLDSSSNNTLDNNTANSNNNYGIWLSSSNSNTIYNNYFSNTVNAWDNGTNTWNTTNTTGPNIVGGLYIGGNYWSDYTGNDTNGDGFGDTPYNITGGSNRDYLPLIMGLATLEGHVDLQGLPATNVTVRFFAPNTTTENVAMKTHTSTDSNGNFTIGNLTPGSYDVGVKGSTSLSNLESGVNLTGGDTTYCDFGVLLEGDASGDDYVDGSDFSLLSVAWQSWPGQPNWDASVDFNRDNIIIDGSDFALLSFGWYQWGDCLGWPGDWT